MNVRVKWEDGSGWYLSAYHNGIELYIVVCTDDHRIVEKRAVTLIVIK